MHSHLSNLSLLPIGIEPKQKAQFDRNTIRHTQLDIDLTTVLTTSLCTVKYVFSSDEDIKTLMGLWVKSSFSY